MGRESAAAPAALFIPKTASGGERLADEQNLHALSPRLGREHGGVTLDGGSGFCTEPIGKRRTGGVFCARQPVQRPGRCVGRPCPVEERRERLAYSPQARRNRRKVCGEYRVYSPHASRSGRESPGATGLQCDRHASCCERTADEILQSGECCGTGAEDAPFVGLPSSVI